MATEAAITGEDIRPPRTQVGPLGWLRANLFSSIGNTLLTLVAGALVMFAIAGLIDWVFNRAQLEVIANNLRILMLGIYPIDQTWRVWATILIGAFLVGLGWGAWGGVLRSIAVGVAAAALVLNVFPIELGTRAYAVAAIILVFVGFLLARGRPRMRRPVIVMGLLFPLVAVLLLRGFGENHPVLPLAKYDVWGGLLLTFTLALLGIVISFPLGVLLALGRRSSLPVVRGLCIAYIELIRGVPLVTILFMSQLMLPLFFGGETTLERSTRALIGVVLFSAAYHAENVRGGLQAIPIGQIEAAKALGMSGLLTTVLIVLPQALRAVLQATAGQFISLFKDTSLVAIVGLTDLLGAGRGVLAKPEYLGLSSEVYVFCAIIFWFFTYTISYSSKRMEAALGVGKR